MSNPLVAFGLFIAEIFVIYFLAHSLLNVSFQLLRKIFRSDRPIIWLLAFLYLPGTILHEISHYFFALILAMNPEEVSILPRIEKNHIQLGHVLYRKHSGDFIRPIIVGIAPFFGAIGALWAIEAFHLFPGQVWWHTVVFGYLILAITANMFSSKQDLVDLVYVIPIFLIIVAVIYIFSIQINTQAVITMLGSYTTFFKALQVPLLFSVVAHGILIVIIKIILSVI